MGDRCRRRGPQEEILRSQNMMSQAYEFDMPKLPPYMKSISNSEMIAELVVNILTVIGVGIGLAFLSYHLFTLAVEYYNFFAPAVP